MLSAQELWDEYHASEEYTITFNYDGTSNLDIDLYMRDGKKVNTMNKEERKKEALDKIEELKKLVEQIDNEGPDIPEVDECSSKGFTPMHAGDTNDNTCSVSALRCATEKQAKSIHAFAALTKIHREIVKRNCPDYTPNTNRDIHFVNENWCITMAGQNLYLDNFSMLVSPLPLPTEELAKAFLDKHRDLWQTFWEGMS